jgi:A/G-specific adenine glycosylase
MTQTRSGGRRPNTSLVNADHEQFRAALLPWAVRVRRDLPWRQTRDPWLICVSEVMLQQTQVDRVAPKWLAFVDRFPTVNACAEAPQADVVRMWEGLGYHRRAVNLHRTARWVADDFDGVFPSAVEELLTLPGVGAYTARAIRAFAFEAEAAVVDTNVGRILARSFGAKTYSAKAAQTLADELVPARLSWMWNQGMLDLGATVCTKRTPACEVCPVQSMCTWYQRGRPTPDPAVGSASVSGGQSRFDGSDRQGRGRLLACLRNGNVDPANLAEAMGWPTDSERAERVAETLLADGLARRVDGCFTLA